jgi:molybdopterin synthase catalytic subunit
MTSVMPDEHAQQTDLASNNSPSTTQVRFFAHLAATLQAKQIPLHALHPMPTTVVELRAALAARFPEIADQLPACRIATDTAFLANTDTLPAHTSLAVIPPVSGG